MTANFTAPSLHAHRTLPLLLIFFTICEFEIGCQSAPPAPVTPPGDVRAPCADHNPQKNVYFGDLHSHTALSFDAYTYDVRTTPKEAYDFARGQTIYLPPLDDKGQPQRPARIDRPLDFAAVTDHSEYLGETSLCTTPGSPAYDAPLCVAYRPPKSSYLGFGVGIPGASRAAFCAEGTDDNAVCVRAALPVWQGIQDAAEAAYDRSAACTFTSFVAYEYTLSPFGTNLHRNVIFRNSHVLPAPITYYDAPRPIDLWRQLMAQCIEGIPGCDVLAIPHNSNISNGQMFVPEYPDALTTGDERQQAQLRGSMEPLVEITQHKGESECVNGLTTFPGAPDELCDFEKIVTAPFPDCGPTGTGSGGFLGTSCTSWLDYVRNVWKSGLSEEARLGVNPYKLGVIGSTDTHNGTPGAVDEKAFLGHLGKSDDTPSQMLTGQVLAARPLVSNPGGLAGVWAEENSRDSIFDALRRRETFGTSGPRIAVRFFGGWAYDPGLCADPAMIKTAYAGGVPMGGDLPARPAAAGAPTFVIAALRDPGTAAHAGAPLQRIQIIKGWIAADGTPQEKVIEVAGDPNNGATVDTATCELAGPGADSLCGVYTDPDFDPALRAFYYARVVENPSCRWSTYVCNTLSPADQAALHCSNLGVPATIQERAWSSPIWYTP